MNHYYILILAILVSKTSAFVGGPHCATTSIPTTNNKRRNGHLFQSNSKNFVDEILDALDTMVGVSPLAETDLKSSSSEDRLVQRAQEREELAPPSDALQKTSVAIFFALLGIIPSLLFLYAVQSGFRPFGL